MTNGRRHPVTFHVSRFIPPSQQRPHPSIPVPPGLAPDAGDRLVAVGAEAVLLHAGAEHEEAVAGDDGRAAVVAAGVLPLADLAGEVARVEVPQPGLAAVLDDLHEVLDAGVA